MIKSAVDGKATTSPAEDLLVVILRRTRNACDTSVFPFVILVPSVLSRPLVFFSAVVFDELETCQTAKPRLVTDLLQLQMVATVPDGPERGVTVWALRCAWHNNPYPT